MWGLPSPGRHTETHEAAHPKEPSHVVPSSHRSRRRPDAALAAGVLTLASVAVAGTPVGALDPTFSPRGKADVTDVLPGRQLVDVGVQKDGKVVAISDQGGDFFVVRFNTDGSLDPTFGLNGTVTVDVGAAAANDQALALAIDAQDRIVVAGRGGASPADFAVVRLSPDGKTGGKAATSTPTSATWLRRSGRRGRRPPVRTARSSPRARPRWGADTGLDCARPLRRTTGAVVGTKFTNESFATGNEEGRAVAVYPSGPNKGIECGRRGDRHLRQQAPSSSTSGSPGGAPGHVVQRRRLQGVRPHGVVRPRTRGGQFTSAGSGVGAGTERCRRQRGGRGSQPTCPSGSHGSTAASAGGANSRALLDSSASSSLCWRPLAVRRDGELGLKASRPRQPATDRPESSVTGSTRDGAPDNTLGIGGGGAFVCAAATTPGYAVAWGPAEAGQLGQGGDIEYGGHPGEAPRDLPLINLGGQQARRDTDGDGVRDAADAGPTVAGTLPNGCSPAAPPASARRRC